MRRSFAMGAFVAGMMLAVPLFAQRVPVSRHAAQAETDHRRYLVGEALLSNRIAADLEILCEERRDRTAGTKEGRAAEDWAFVRMRDAGLAGVRFEDFRFDLWQERAVEAVAVTEEGERVLQPLALARSATTEPEGIVLPLAEAGHCSSAEVAAAGNFLRGRAVLCRSGVSEAGTRVHRLEQISLISGAGGAALLAVSDVSGALPRAGSVGIDVPAGIPAVSLSREEGEWLWHRLESDGDQWKIRIRVEADLGRARARNVIGEIAGENREEILLLGAHLDAWNQGAGALDNGTGVGVLLETARLLVQLQEKGWRPARTLRFALFMAEEQGLIGSRAYVAEHRRELDRTRAMVNLEMVGDPRAYMNHGHDEAVSLLDATARRLRGLGLGSTRTGIPLHSDHQSFLLEGVPTFSLLSALPPAQHQVYHSAADTFDKLDFPLLQRAAAATAVLLYDLASADSLPLRRYGPDETRALLEVHGVLGVLDREGILFPGSRRE